MNKEGIEELKREIRFLKQANIEYKNRIDVAIHHMKLTIDIIKQQPSDNPLDDLWIISKLEALINTLIVGELNE